MIEDRPGAVPHQLRRSTWIWAYEVKALPDLMPDRDSLAFDSDVVGDWLRRHAAMLQALAEVGTPGSALQLRFFWAGPESAQGNVIRVHIVGVGRSNVDASLLASMVRSVLPHEIDLEPVIGDVGAQVPTLDLAKVSTAGVVELRRRIESMDPLDAAERIVDPPMPVVLSWDGGPAALSQVLRLMTHQPSAIALVLHVEPARVSGALITHLEASLRELAVTEVHDSMPLAANVLESYRLRLRSLPRAALRMRTTIASAADLTMGLAEAVGVVLAGENGAALVRPESNHEIGLALSTVETFETSAWREAPDQMITELQDLVTVWEAARIFHLPLVPHGGIAQLPSARVSMLPRAAEIDMDSYGIRLGTNPAGSPVRLSLADLNKHVLVAGLPGFGKTTTVQGILRALVERGVPFLVIDPAKSDYAALIDRVVADGNPLGARARRFVLDAETPAFNPFAVPVGCSPATHAGRVLAAFDTALSLSVHWPLGFITLGRGIFAAYERCAPGEFPTLRTVYAAVGDVIRRSKFGGPDGMNVRASLLGRLEFLVRGPLGVALTAGSDGGVDWADLVATPTVIELRRFAGPTERSLVFALLLAGLVSYRESNPTPGTLSHVTVLEEAHRILAITDEGAGDGVRLFLESLAELRGSGEGFVVVDQAPTTLHPSVAKLTGTVLTHRLVASEERAAAGSALLLDDRQSDDLARLAVGEAVMHSPSRRQSVAVRLDWPSTDEIVAHQPPSSTLMQRGGSDEVFCVGCAATCLHEPEGSALGRTFVESIKPQGVAQDRGLLEIVERLGTRREISRARLRCAAGHALAAMPRDVPFLARLDALDRSLALADLRGRAGGADA